MLHHLRLLFSRLELETLLLTEISGLVGEAMSQGIDILDLKADSSQQLVRSWGPQSSCCKEKTSSNKLREFGSRFFPYQASKGKRSPVDALTAAW